MPRKPRRITRAFTAEEQSRHRKLRAQVDSERDEILSRGRQYKAAHDAAVASLGRLLQTLKAERERLGLSLRDLSERAGIDHAMLSRLETGKLPNPTFATLSRYALAVGKSIEVILREPAESAAGI
jgi:ribosome-binding protein aMBF1 (putative translation factor)